MTKITLSPFDKCVLLLLSIAFLVIALVALPLWTKVILFILLIAIGEMIYNLRDAF